MAAVAEHLGIAELEELHRSCKDVTASRHYQMILRLAKGIAPAAAAFPI